MASAAKLPNLDAGLVGAPLSVANWNEACTGMWMYAHVRHGWVHFGPFKTCLVPAMPPEHSGYDVTWLKTFGHQRVDCANNSSKYQSGWSSLRVEFLDVVLHCRIGMITITIIIILISDH